SFCAQASPKFSFSGAISSSMDSIAVGLPGPLAVVPLRAPMMKPAIARSIATTATEPREEMRVRFVDPKPDVPIRQPSDTADLPRAPAHQCSLECIYASDVATIDTGCQDRGRAFLQ